MAVPVKSINKRSVAFDFQVAAVAADDGEYIDVSGFDSMNIEVRGITTATVQIWGYNKGTTDADPTPATDYTQIGSDITADGRLTIDRHEMPSHVKAKISAYTSGTIEVRGLGKLTPGGSIKDL